ncbi:MAG: 4a-hydroxytetrahydrobiopterin dehydratase [Chlamydiia bacterium]|nr:4a-hydroxytetrahydrobiopterin dehydratase [Chlamydiia bacterium]
MEKIKKKKCVPCLGAEKPLKGNQLQHFQDQLDENWQIVGEHHLEKTYKCKNFKEALAFVNDVGHIAEEEQHHPDMELSWNKVKLLIWTHKIDGLTENDFILAAKCDAAFIGRFG